MNITSGGEDFPISQNTRVQNVQRAVDIQHNLYDEHLFDVCSHKMCAESLHSLVEQFSNAHFLLVLDFSPETISHEIIFGIHMYNMHNFLGFDTPFSNFMPPGGVIFGAR